MSAIVDFAEENAVPYGYLYDWYIASVADDEPVWTDEHIREMSGDFYMIPKSVVDELRNAKVRPELKRCPMCGGGAELESKENYSSHTFWRVVCQTCGAGTFCDEDGFGYEDDPGKKRAVAEWNARYEDAKDEKAPACSELCGMIRYEQPAKCAGCKDDCSSCEHGKEAIGLLGGIKKKIGDSILPYAAGNRHSLSVSQETAGKNAMRFAMEGRYTFALKELRSFLGEGDHPLTSSEFLVLDIAIGIMEEKTGGAV